MSKRVLLVEPDRTQVQTIGRPLVQTRKDEVAVAATPAAALASFKEKQPQIVISRLIFPPTDAGPQMSGTELMQKLHEIDADLKMVMSYDVDTKHLLMEAMRSGAVGRIRRPFEAERVLKMMEEVEQGAQAAAAGRIVRFEKPLAVTYKKQTLNPLARKKTAMTRHLSVGGMMMKTTDSLARDDEINVEIILRGGQPPVSARAEVRRVKAAAVSQSYEVQCTFTEISPEDTERLTRFLQSS